VSDPDQFTAETLPGCVEKFEQFAANWNVPTNRTSLKMFLACALDGAMIASGMTAIGDELWERYYQQVLNVWLARSQG
jgi:hypothetical protein